MEILDIKNILIVDDQPEHLQSIADFFAESKLPYKIRKAPSANIALNLIKIKIPDLIITDWEMPEMDGIEFVKQLRVNCQTANIPIIMCTGAMTTSEHLEISMKAGATDYIRKPVDPIELIARTRSILKINDLQKEIIEQKNRELAENSIYLVQSNKFHEKMVKDLQNLNKKFKKGEDPGEFVNTIINDLDTQLKEESWKRFDIYFQRVHKEFQKNLLNKFPNLTVGELRLCIFLRMGMNSKDISAAISQTVGTVKVSRFRLREKLNMQKEENLTVFLSRF